MKKNNKVKQAQAKKKRRTFSELFLAKLKELAGPDRKMIGNSTLMKELRWDTNPDRYKRIHAELRTQNLIMVGPGQGGTVGLANLTESGQLKVFVSYCHEDEEFKNALLKHLKPLERLNLINSWHDGKIKPGEDWGRSISDNLEQADIVLLLVSVDFINSSYCHDVELERALEKEEEGQSRVIPIIVRPCLWTRSRFARLQALPRDARASSLWPSLDDACLNIAEGVLKVAEELLENRLVQ